MEVQSNMLLAAVDVLGVVADVVLAVLLAVVLVALVSASTL